MWKCLSCSILLTICFLLNQNECQICTKRVVLTQWNREAIRYTYIETYKARCWLRSCIKSRVKTNIDYRVVPRKTVETRSQCCSGYTDVSSTPERMICKPICLPTCINGYCEEPGVCACNDGFIEDQLKKHYCIPVCSNDCSNGKCILPNICQCDSGYTQVNETCQPICNETCQNGICTGPDTCECLPGYRKSEKNICEPYCFNGCPNGHCIAPDTCNCTKGWIINTERNTCHPNCSFPCGNGTCVAPNTCECSLGYNVDSNYVESSNATLCVPSCDNCVNGTCVFPNKCICESPLIPKLVSQDYSECLNNSTTCDKTICVLEELTTSTLSIPYLTADTTLTENPSSNSESDTENTKKALFPSSTPATTSMTYESTETHTTDSFEIDEEVASTTKIIISYYTTNEPDSIESKVETIAVKINYRLIWIYASIPVVLLVILLLIIAIVKRNSIKNRLNSGSYVVRDDRLQDISLPPEDISYQGIITKRKQANKRENS